LPTEAEWEYACRAGTTTPFHFGKKLNGTQANCNGNYPYGTTIMGPYLEKTSTVGSYPANAWGLHDMHGKVWEWCSDWYGEYSDDKIADPQGPKKGGLRVLRGGAWNRHSELCRASHRGRGLPGDRYNNVGFRVLLPLDF
jgi:formylglycine-generating enzyme required for sulfatase activity